MGDGVGVVADQRQFGGPHREQAVLFLHQAAQREHAQADGDRVVEVLARDVDVRARGFKLLDELFYLRFQLQL